MRISDWSSDVCSSDLFHASLWISADSLRFVAQNECAEARNFYIFSLGQRTAHMVEYGFDHFSGLRTGQAYCPLQSFSQIGTRQRLLRSHAFPNQLDRKSTRLNSSH